MTEGSIQLSEGTFGIVGEGQGEMIGLLASVWRYPVKSMLGEQLNTGLVTGRGLVGDRAYALVDVEDGKVASAKNPRKWGALLTFQASFTEPPRSEGDLPPVRITLPDGSTVRSDDEDVDEVLSKALGREVILTATASETQTFEECWPAIEGLAPQEFIDRTRIDTGDPSEVITELPISAAAPAGTWFDYSVLHVLSTATLDQLAGLCPGSRFAAARYRPNLLVEAAGPGFIENGWPGRILSIGERVRIRITISTPRCVMTTLLQPGLPSDPAVLQAVARFNRLEIPESGPGWACAGAYADVLTPGLVCRGDPVILGTAAE